MDHANEYDSDFWDGFGEVVDALTCPHVNDINEVDHKIVSYHIEKMMALNKEITKRVNIRKKKIIHHPFDLNKFFESKDSIQSMIVYDSNYQSLSEDVVFCLRQINETKVKIFFVSKEYNVNFASDSSTNPIAARFLFSEDQYLLAVAEVPAVEVSDYSEKDIENLYTERRRGKQPGKFYHLLVP